MYRRFSALSSDSSFFFSSMRELYLHSDFIGHFHTCQLSLLSFPRPSCQIPMLKYSTRSSYSTTSEPSFKKSLKHLCRHSVRSVQTCKTNFPKELPRLLYQLATLLGKLLLTSPIKEQALFSSLEENTNLLRKWGSQNPLRAVVSNVLILILILKTSISCNIYKFILFIYS